MTEFNYLLWCANCGTRQQFLGGTLKAICIECGLVVMSGDFIRLSDKANEEYKREEKNKLIKRKIVELFNLVKEDK